MKFVRQSHSSAYLVKSPSPRVGEFIRRHIQGGRRIYTEEGWLLYKLSDAVDVAKIALQDDPKTDYSELPELFWEEIKEFGEKRVSQNTDPYGVLFLTPQAPPYIVDVVFRALAKKHHPDTGGDAVQFKRINEAYQKIKA